MVNDDISFFQHTHQKRNIELFLYYLHHLHQYLWCSINNFIFYITFFINRILTAESIEIKYYDDIILWLHCISVKFIKLVLVFVIPSKMSIIILNNHHTDLIRSAYASILSLTNFLVLTILRVFNHFCTLADRYLFIFYIFKQFLQKIT